MTTAPDHLDVAAYVLGILDADEVEAFENHLTQCRRCALDLRDFAVVPDLIDEADAGGMLRGTAPERPDGKSVRAMLDSVAAKRRKRRWHLAQGVAAAAAALVAVTVVVTSTIVSGGDDNAAGSTSTQSTSQSQSRLAEADNLAHAGNDNSATGVSGKIEATDESWGTTLELEVSGMAGPGRGYLTAVSRTGKTLPVTSWFAPEPVGGDKPTLRVTGTVAMRWHDIAHFKVQDDNGKVLLEISAS